MTVKSYADRIREIDEYALKLKGLVPEAMGAFGQLSRAAQAPGVLDPITKELIALAIGVSQRCDGCIAYHSRNLVRLGADRQALAEMLAVTIQMGGGPTVNYAADALRAFDEFAAAAAPKTA